VPKTLSNPKIQIYGIIEQDILHRHREKGGSSHTITFCKNKEAKQRDFPQASDEKITNNTVLNSKLQPEISLDPKFVIVCIVFFFCVICYI
jgi:hypothetical protein